MNFLKKICLIVCVLYFAPAGTAFAETLVTYDKKCILHQDYGSNRCAICASVGGGYSNCYSFSDCYQNDGNIEYHYQDWGSRGGYLCTAAGWCRETLSGETIIPSRTVTGGRCYGSCYEFNKDSMTMNADGTCICRSMSDCTYPDFCIANYVLQGSTCVECPIISGSIRGRSAEHSTDLGDCYALPYVDHTDSTGTYHFIDDCYYET